MNLSLNIKFLHKVCNVITIVSLAVKISINNYFNTTTIKVSKPMPSFGLNIKLEGILHKYYFESNLFLKKIKRLLKRYKGYHLNHQLFCGYRIFDKFSNLMELFVESLNLTFLNYSRIKVMKFWNLFVIQFKLITSLIFLNYFIKINMKLGLKIRTKLFTIIYMTWGK